MSQREIEICEEEHDLARDEVLEELQEINDESIMAAHAHGHVTAGIMILAGILSRESLASFCDHIKECAHDYCNAIDGVEQ